MAGPIRVLLVDDSEESRDILRRALSMDGGIDVVGEAGSGAEAVREAQTLRPDVVVMDVRMPDGNGIQATTEITQRLPGVRVLALTAHEDQDSVREMLAAGAIGYLVKGSSVEDLTSAIHKARGGEARLDERVLPHALGELRTLLREERKRRADAERLARTREEFIQVLSHELRTPLTVIAGTLQFLERQPLPEGADDLIAAALRRTENLSRVVEGLELIGQPPAAPDIVTVPREALRRTLDAVSERPDSVEAPDDAWPGVHPHHVARAAEELVTNAIRHGRRPIHVRAGREGLEATVEVSDAGTFDPDPELFRAFVQADMSVERRQGGLGLGLFVASRLCEAAGGRLTIGRRDDRTVAEATFVLAAPPD